MAQESEIPVLYPQPVGIFETSAVSAMAREVYDHSKGSVVNVAIKCANGFAGHGSGVLVRDGQDLSIVTNLHVVAAAQSIIVTNAAGESFAAKIDKVSDRDDLAALKIEGSQGFDKKLALNLADTSKLTPGQPLFALGYPDNYGRPTLSQGAFEQVSKFSQVAGASTANILRELAGQLYPDNPAQAAAAEALVASPRVQAAVLIDHGSSGGALLDKDSNLAGILEEKEDDQPGQSNSVSAERVKALLDSPGTFDFHYKRQILAEEHPAETVAKAAALIGVAASPFNPMTRRLAAPLTGLYYGEQALDDLRLLGQDNLYAGRQHYLAKLAVDGGTFVAGALTLVPRLRLLGMAVVGAHLAYDLANDYRTTRPVLEKVTPHTDAAKKESPGGQAEPFLWSAYHRMREPGKI